MKLRSRLSYYSLFIFGVLFVFTSIVIYTLFYRWARQNEYKNLQNTTLVSAVYYLEKDEQTHAEHVSVRNELQRLISQTNIAVYDSTDKQAFGKMDHDVMISPEVLAKTRADDYHVFESKTDFYAGIHYHDNQGDFVVFTRSSKASFKELMYVLLGILSAVFVSSLLIILVFSRWLGTIAYQPILRIIEQVNARNHQNLTVPIAVDRSYEEVDELIQTYNRFIKRIGQTFDIQKNFIDYVSHELRTPITALLGTLEVTNQKNRSVEEYQGMVKQLDEYIHDLQATLDHMMLLTGAKTSFEFKPMRIDEVLWEVVEHATMYHEAQIEVRIDVEDNQLLEMNGNDKLLELAINNLVENAIKYSDNQVVHLILHENDGHLSIQIVDQGIGIPAEDLERCTQNFFRGQNTSAYQGKGIGLSMASIVFSLHSIQMDIASSNQGTTVTLLFLKA
ncbi:HAMP domain-containing histidine kinase [Sphingobacterium sp. lm-10]|uniref:sensor histidine kinase n=1 Tax=Sphingobacterium sp. lm-10 TaxID=2944904 RepID=UPI002021F01D|nr:HAMP domain-containing sensor histidine kinase [Sphingobacterium sp. lm-10]MCL7987879.1 HAMP domain-containing histidine kinase [Sphingobacterium sp. lm-10]